VEPVLKFTWRAPTFVAMERQTGGKLRAVPEVDERRHYQRVEPEGATVVAALPTGTATFAIDNLSEGGALIAGKIAVEAGGIVDLCVQLPGLSAIGVRARVLRHVPRADHEYTAVMFLSSSEALAHWISDVVLEGLRAAFPDL